VKQRYGKLDANHTDVVKWYRELGCSVAQTQDAGLGVPDLFVGCVGITDPVEIKTEDGKLKPSQQNFVLSWRGSTTRIVRTQAEVVAHVTDMRRRVRHAEAVRTARVAEQAGI
jgi:hypothetical protein